MKLSQNIFHFSPVFPLILFFMLIGGCVDSDITASFYFHPNGQVDVVNFIDNISSAADRPEKRKQDETQWVSDFRSGKLPDIKRMRAAHGKNIKTILLKDKVPYSAVIRGSFDSIEAFANYMELNKKGDQDRIEFVHEQKHRKITFSFAGNPESAKYKTPQTSESEKKLYPVIKLIAVNARISKGNGCQIIDEGRFCLVNLQEIDKQEQQFNKAQIQIEWDIP